MLHSGRSVRLQTGEVYRYSMQVQCPENAKGAVLFDSALMNKRQICHLLFSLTPPLSGLVGPPLAAVLVVQCHLLPILGTPAPLGLLEAPSGL